MFANVLGVCRECRAVAAAEDEWCVERDGDDVMFRSRNRVMYTTGYR